MAKTEPSIVERLRNACTDIRRKPFPIGKLIPLMLEAADRIDVLERAGPPPAWSDDECLAVFNMGGMPEPAFSDAWKIGVMRNVLAAIEQSRAV